jgi:HEAT repeat protein
VANLLKSMAKSSAAEALWSYVATPERLERELAASPVDHQALSILVDRIGAQAADSLLDRLASASDRSTRAAVLKQLLALGPAVGPAAAARLPGAPWFVQRNILVLLGRLGSWPTAFSPAEYASNPDSRVRREAIKLMLESATHRGEGITRGLADPDWAITGLALAAAVDACPFEAIPMAQRIAADLKRPSELRVLAVRVLARSRTPESLRVLHELVLHRRRWLGRRLAPKSPELLAALAALATHWPGDPTAADVLQRALQHSDPDIRAAAGRPAP